MGIENISNSEIAELTQFDELAKHGIVLEKLRVPCKPYETAEEIEEISDVFGNPDKDAEAFENCQESSKSGLICCKLAVEQLLEKEVSLSAFTETAQKSGLYRENCGMTLKEMTKLLELFGLETDEGSELNLMELCETLESGEKTVCTVSRAILKHPQLADFPGISPDSAVEIIGVDSSGDLPKVILNDPMEDSGGISYGCDEFKAAFGGRRYIFAGLGR